MYTPRDFGSEEGGWQSGEDLSHRIHGTNGIFTYIYHEF